MTVITTVTVEFKIPEEEGQLRAFRQTHDMKAWKLTGTNDYVHMTTQDVRRYTDEHERDAD